MADNPDPMVEREVVGRDALGFVYVKEHDGSVGRYKEVVLGNHIRVKKVASDNGVDQDKNPERVSVRERWAMTDQGLTGEKLS